MLSSRAEGPDRFLALAESAFAEIPEALRRHCAGIVFRVADWPDRATLDEMGIDHPLDLLGLYHGVSIDQQSVLDSGRLPDMIWLYREPILAYVQETGEALADVVRNVLVHEIGHHFGFSDDDMHDLEDEAD
ncbi:MAG: metallopeptidase family protein [Sneathiellaceae bacterium]